MTEEQRNVKVRTTFWARCLDFVDARPRSGWFLAAVFGLNTILNLLTVIILLLH